MALMVMLINEKDFSVVKFGNAIYCFSFEKNIGMYNIENDTYDRFSKMIVSTTNKEHYERFVEFVEKEYKVNRK